MITTNNEMAAYLIALATVVMTRDQSAATLHAARKEDLLVRKQLVKVMTKNGVSKVRAEEICLGNMGIHII